MNNKVKILLFAKSIDGGTGSVTLTLQKLTKYGFDVATIVLEAPSKRKVASRKIQYFHKKNFYPSKYSFTANSIVSFIRELFWFRRICSDESAHIIISLDIHCNLIAVMCRLLDVKGPRLVLTTHINLKDTLREKSSRLLNSVVTRAVRLMYNKADILVSSSITMKKSLMHDFHVKKRIVVIPYGISLGEVKSVPKNPKEKIILSVGRLVEQKDFFTLIDAFEKVQNLYKSCRLVIIGDGYLKQQITQRVQRSFASRYIALVGWKENTAHWIANADIFVLTSRREGFPIVLLEALAVGTPIVSTDAPYGPAEILQNGRYGLLAKVGDSNEVADKLLRLLNSKRTYNLLVKRSKERSKLYAEDRMLNSYHSVIASLLRKATQPPKEKQVTS